MAKNEIKEQLKSYEGYNNAIPLIIGPCKRCKVYKKKDGYDTGHFKSNGDWVEGVCKQCCWFFDSKYEVVE